MAEASVILPDVLQADLDVVFCGTAPSRRSAADGAYYAHPGNFFWRTLFDAGFTPRRLAPREFPLLPDYGIGLTDLAKHASGNDDQLPSGAFDVAALVAKIETFRPRCVAFTSKNAAQAALGHAVGYGEQVELIGVSRLFVLPSPSGQARRFWSIEPWRELARGCREST